MTITANAAVRQNSATEHTAISDTVAIANGAFNVGTVTAVTPTDKTYTAKAVLQVTMAVAPVANKYFSLYRRDLNIQGTNDSPVPGADYEHKYIDKFFLDIVTAQQFVVIDSIPISDDQEFYIKNETGQATTGTTAVYITPTTPNVKA